MASFQRVKHHAVAHAGREDLASCPFTAWSEPWAEAPAHRDHAASFAVLCQREHFSWCHSYKVRREPCYLVPVVMTTFPFSLVDLFLKLNIVKEIQSFLQASWRWNVTAQVLKTSLRALNSSQGSECASRMQAVFLSCRGGDWGAQILDNLSSAQDLGVEPRHCPERLLQATEDFLYFSFLLLQSFLSLNFPPCLY